MGRSTASEYFACPTVIIACKRLILNCILTCLLFHKTKVKNLSKSLLSSSSESHWTICTERYFFDALQALLLLLWLVFPLFLWWGLTHIYSLWVTYLCIASWRKFMSHSSTSCWPSLSLKPDRYFSQNEWRITELTNLKFKIRIISKKNPEVFVEHSSLHYLL